MRTTSSIRIVLAALSLVVALVGSAAAVDASRDHRPRPDGYALDPASILKPGVKIVSGAPEAPQARLAQNARFYARAAVLGAARGEAPAFAGRPFPPPRLERPPKAETSRRPSRPDAGSGLAEYDGPFGRVEAAHLLRRALIGARLFEIERAEAEGLAATADRLFALRPPPEPPGDWAVEPVPDMSDWSDARVDSLVQTYFQRNDRLKLWWTQTIIGDDPGLREAMTLFWHDHFATATEKVFVPASMYIQNRTLRTHALGSFREMLHAIALDPAMLSWLDGNLNTRDGVNENFARELLELFTMGVGHYTQDDVRAAARAFTGYVSWDGVEVVFVDEWHDDGEKTFLGHTGPFLGPDILEIILEQPETVRFLVEKLGRYFVGEHLDEGFIEELATTLREKDYQIAPVVRRMLLSARFFDAAQQGAVYADGIDRSIGLLRAFHLAADYTDPESPTSRWTLGAPYTLGQVLLDPPNVGGWPGYRSWLNSHTLAYRRLFALSLLEGALWGEDLGMRVDPVALAEELEGPDDPDAIVDGLAVSFCGMPPTPAVRARLRTELLQGMSPDEWSIRRPDAPDHLRSLLRFLVRLPDFQLK